MKIKNDFITNSSSVSFCVWGIYLDFLEITEEIARKLHEYFKHIRDFELYKNTKESLFEDLRIFCNENDLDHISRGNMFQTSYLICGISPEKMRGNQTLNEFKNEIREKLKIIGINKELEFILISWEDR